MTFPMIEGAFSADLYNRALSSAYSLWSRLNNPDYALQRDPEIWEKVRRDATIAQAIDTRLHMIAGRTWHCEAGGNTEEDRRAAALCDDLISRIRGFTESRLQLATSCFRARAYSFIECSQQVETFLDGVPRQWWVPMRLRDVDPRRIRYVPEHYYDEAGLERVRVHQQLWSVMREEYEDIPAESLRQFVKVIYRNEEANLGYGRGLLSSVYFLWWMKSIVWREGLQGLERWSQGVLIGKVAGDREGSTGRTNEAIRDDLFEALRDMRSRNIIVMGAEDDIEVRDGGGTGHQMVMDFVRYMDEKLLSLILGSVLPFGGGAESGSFARAQIEQETTNALIQFDRDKIDECLTDDLVGYIWEANWSNIQAMGLGSAEIPRFTTDLAPREDPQGATAMIASLAQLGVPLRLSDVYDKTGFSAPGPEDEVFEATLTSPESSLPFAEQLVKKPEPTRT